VADSDLDEFFCGAGDRKAKKSRSKPKKRRKLKVELAIQPKRLIKADCHPGRTWYSVRSFVCFPNCAATPLYEERVVIFLATSFDDALEQAEAEAKAYVADIDGEDLDLYQAFCLFGDDARLEDGLGSNSGHIASGDEVYSLIRTSYLPPSEYLTHFFDTGAERQQN
jgi:hypothetical protein